MFVLAYKKIDPDSKGIAVRAKIFTWDLEEVSIPVHEEMRTSEKPEPFYYKEAVINKRISAEIRHPLIIIRKLQYFTVAFRGYVNQWHPEYTPLKGDPLYEELTSKKSESSGTSLLPEPTLTWVENVRGTGNPKIYDRYGTSIELNLQAGSVGPKSGPFMELEILLKPIVHQQQGEIGSFNKDMQCEQYYTKMTGEHWSPEPGHDTPEKVPYFENLELAAA
jgi:hypothetical protein